MRYSVSFKKSILKMVLPPNNESVLKVCKEIGISNNAIYNWIKKAKYNTLEKDSDVFANQRELNEKFQLLMESKNIPESEFGAWLRKNGLHSEHLNLFEQEVRLSMIKNDQEDKQLIKELK